MARNDLRAITDAGSAQTCEGILAARRTEMVLGALQRERGKITMAKWNWLALGVGVLGASLGGACGGGDSPGGAASGNDSAALPNAPAGTGGGSRAEQDGATVPAAGSGASGTGSAGGARGTPATGDCSGLNLAAAPRRFGYVTFDQTWSGINLVEEVDVQGGAVITIEPGSTLVMEADGYLDFDEESTLLARGTEAAPIVICGREPGTAYWSRIQLSDVGPDTVLQNLVISGGLTRFGLFAYSPARFENVRLIDMGVQASAFAPGSSGLVVEHSLGSPMEIDFPSALVNFPINSRILGPEPIVLDFLTNTRLEADATLYDLGTPYAQSGDLNVVNGATLTIQAGVQIGYNGLDQLGVGLTEPGGLRIEGTPESPVVLKGNAEIPGAWIGVRLGPNTLPDSRLSNVQILHGGDGGNALDTEAAVLLDGVSVEQFGNTGVLIRAPGVAAGSRLKVRASGRYPLSVDPGALLASPAVEQIGSEPLVIRVENGPFSQQGTLPNLGVPYGIFFDLELVDNASLTIAPGTRFQMSLNTALRVGTDGELGTLIARGTPEAPIVFEGIETTAGYWEGIVIGAGASAQSAIENVEIAHGGDACLTLETAVPVSSANIHDCVGFGILAPAGASASYAGNQFSAVPSGNVGELSTPAPGAAAAQ